MGLGSGAHGLKVYRLGVESVYCEVFCRAG